MANENANLTNLSALEKTAERLKAVIDDQANAIEGIKETVPTKVSSLTNDAGYQTGSQVATAIQTAIAQTGHASFQVVSAVPSASSAQENILYLVKNTTTGYYDIYAKVVNEVVRLDDVSIDLSGYVQKEAGKGLSTNDFTTAEKNKLNGITEGANNYTHPTTAGNKHIPSGGSSGQILRWGSNGTAVWGAENNTTYSVVTSSSNGLMSSADKTKLDGINVATDEEVAAMIKRVFG